MRRNCCPRIAWSRLAQAQGLVIDADLAEELEPPVVGRAAMGDPSNPKAIEVDRVGIESIDIGGVSLTGVIADSWELPSREFAVTFDYKHGLIAFERSERP